MVIAFTLWNILSPVIGVGRAWYNILPFKVAVEMLQVTNSDQGVTLGMIALGVGFGIGTLPAGNCLQCILVSSKLKPCD